MAARGDANNAALELLLAGEKLVGRLQLRIYQVLTVASPVDTGFFRSRWTPTVSRGNAPKPGEEAPRDKKAAKKDASEKFKVNKARAIAIAQTYKLRQGNVLLRNPTKYGPFLAAGSSSQRSAGWIERGINKAVRSIGRTNISQRGPASGA